MTDPGARRSAAGGVASRGGDRRAALHRAVETLQRLAELFERRRRQLAGEAGVTDGQWRLLEEIAREDFLPSLFARRRERTPAAVSRTLRQLLERGLVRAGISPVDGRQREYVLTPRGRRLLGRLRESRAHALESVWTGFSRAELERFARFGEALAERLESYAHERGP